MYEGLLPIGSVVLLTQSRKRVMIVGVCQRAAKDPGKIWDYVGVVFPEGFLASDKMLMFNREQIVRVFALGYQDEEQMTFQAKANTAIQNLRKEKE